MAVLDTSFLIALERQEQKAQAKMNTLQDAGLPVLVPAAVWLEYLSGIPARIREQAARILAQGCDVVPFDQGLADRAVLWQDELMRQGKPLGWHDLQVAATALQRHEELVTYDQGFAAIPGIEPLAP